MTAETHDSTINVNNTTNDPDKIDESWALMLLLDNESDIVDNSIQTSNDTKVDNNSTRDKSASIKAVEDEVISITPREIKPRVSLSAIEHQSLNYNKNKQKNNIKKKRLPSFRSLLGI